MNIIRSAAGASQISGAVSLIYSVQCFETNIALPDQHLHGIQVSDLAYNDKIHIHVIDYKSSNLYFTCSIIATIARFAM